jgi:Na+-translocating ferredoxin:NAD+ oxidoreductase RnfC subunit
MADDNTDRPATLSVRIGRPAYELLRKAAFEEREPMSVIVNRAIMRELGIIGPK